MVIIGLVPPPANLAVLHKLQAIVAKHPATNILIARNFNMTPNPNVDKLYPDLAVDSALSRWVELFGLHDTWWWKHPYSRHYTCYSATHATLS